MGRAAAVAAAVFTTLLMSVSSPAEPAGGANSALLQAGDIGVTGFPGTTLATDKLPPGVDPIDRTFIDPSGPSLRVFAASSLNGAPAGQLLNAPPRLSVPAKDVGQVFALAVDPGTNGGPPNLFAAATSAFGLSVVGAGRAADGKPVRLKSGAPDATFMEGQFGALSSNSPGAIYKIDGATGAATYIADTAFSGVLNTGAGIGGLAYDPTSRTLYASDLDSGLIHRFGLDYNAADLGQFDHGVAGRRASGLPEVADDGKRLDVSSDAFKADDPGTWGLTQPQRRVDALAVHDGRLYYAVAEGPEIWSVGLNAVGAFLTDARREVVVKAEKPFPVTAITFDAGGNMLLAQRSPVKSPYDFGSFTDTDAQVLRYSPKSPDDKTTPDLWKSDPATYAVGTADKGNAGSGGVSLQYGYKPDGSIDLGTCDGGVAFTGDTLGTGASGVQLNGLELVRPQNDPPSQSAFIDYDTNQEDPGVRGHVGSVAAVRLCGATAGFPPVEAGMPPVEEGGAAPPVEGGGAAPPVEGGGGEAFPPVEEGGGGTAGGGGETFPPIDEGGGGETAEAGGVSITKSPGSGTCTQDGGCSFNIDITNNSGAPTPELVVGDELTAGAANLGGAKIEGTPPAPWTCTAPPKFTCKHPPIADGETVSLPLSFTPTGIGQEPELKNCATLNPQQGAGQPNPAPVLPAATTGGEKGLKFEQVPLTQPCTTGQACEWELRVTNTRATPVTGALQWHGEFDFVQDNAKARATAVTIDSVTANPSATCNPVANNDLRQMSCAVDLVTIPANQTFSVKMKVAAQAPANAPTGGLQATAFASFFETNQDQTIGTTGAAVALVPPGQGPDQANGGGAAAPIGPVCATLPVAQTEGEKKEQPTPSAAGQLSLVKTGVSCKDNRLCTFNFAISNTSATAFDGTVEFDDSITGDGATFGATAITPAPPAPWSCPKSGQGFKCSANLKIPANSAAPPLSLTFDLGPGIGAVQTAENCATLKDAPTPSCSKLPMQAVGPQPDPNGKAALSITKTGPAECSDLGGCDFSIAIKNDGDAPFNGPVNVDEEVTLDGKSLSGTLIVPNQTWKCTPGGTSTCTSIPQMIIGPKGTATLRVHVIFTALMGAKTMQNCASVPGQTAKACASVPLIQGPKLVLKKQAIDGVCDPLCTFRITATNIGNAEFKGPVELIDTVRNASSTNGPIAAVDVALEFVSAKLVNSQGKLDCKQANDTAVSCDIQHAFPPGMSATIELTVKSKLTDFAADNCIGRRDIPGGDPDTSCTSMLGLRNAGPNLVIDKEAPNAAAHGDTGHCGLKEFCKFTVTIKNIGSAPFTGVLHLTDSVGPGTPSRILKGNGLGTCTEAQNVQGAGGFALNSIQCDIGPFPDGIRPNDQVQLEMIAVAGEKWGSGKNMQNCAELTSDSDMGPADTPKKDCADVKLDPFDVAVAKTGDQNCKPGGECRFDIDIFNPNPSVTHNDPVTVTDKLSGLSSAQIVSITPQAPAQDFPCKPRPTQIPFTCSGHMKLQPGDHNHYTMIIRLPADASAASFSNCATVGGARSSGETTDPSCHAVQLKPPAEHPFSLKIDKTGPASCKPGAECPFDLTLTNTGAKDHAGGVTLTDGLSNAPPMTIVSIEPPLPCATQPAEIPFNCKTADDFTLPAGGKRTFKVTARVPRSADASFTNCAILASATAPRTGGVPDGAVSSCHTVSVSTPPTQTNEKPECKGGMILMDEGLCACPPGTTWSGRSCITRRPPVEPAPLPVESGGGGTTVNTCPRSLPVGTYPDCCPRDTHFERSVGRRGACVSDAGKDNGGTNGSKGGEGGPDTKPPVCEGRRPVGTYPNCCPRDMHFERGACRRDTDNGKDGNGGTNGNTGPTKTPVCEGRRPVGTFPNCCPRGMHFERGACRRDTDNGKDGNGGTNGNTGPTKTPVCEGRRPVGTFPNCCPLGTHFERGACRRDTDNGKDGNGGTQGSKQGDGKCTRGIVGCRPKQPCTGGRIGTPPNCSCPPGTHETRSGQCETNASPTKETPKTEPSNGKCTGGRVGTPPNCFCPPPTKFIGRRCRLVSKPTTPTPTGPSPKKQCSGGKVPRSGDGACVCPSGTTDRGGQCVEVVK